MQRIDNDIKIDNSTSIKFTILQSDANLPNYFPGCLSGCYEFKILDKMGINYQSDAVLDSDEEGNMGGYGEAITIAGMATAIQKSALLKFMLSKSAPHSYNVRGL